MTQCNKQRSGYTTDIIIKCEIKYSVPLVIINNSKEHTAWANDFRIPPESGSGEKLVPFSFPVIIISGYVKQAKLNPPDSDHRTIRSELVES